jgi:hypothetical protein
MSSGFREQPLIDRRRKRNDSAVVLCVHLANEVMRVCETDPFCCALMIPCEERKPVRDASQVSHTLFPESHTFGISCLHPDCEVDVWRSETTVVPVRVLGGSFATPFVPMYGSLRYRLELMWIGMCR